MHFDAIRLGWTGETGSALTRPVPWLFGKAFEGAGQSLSLMFFTLSLVAVQQDSNFPADQPDQYE